MISAGGLTTACGAEEQQASTELPSASSTSAEPTPELPPLGPADFPVPDEARVKDEAGAEAFSRYYVELLNREQSLPSGDAIRSLGPKCADCLAIARRLDEAAAAGFRIEGGQIAMVGQPGVALFDDRAEVAFNARVEKVAAYGRDGNVVPDSVYPPQDSLPSGLRLTWDSSKSSWVVQALTLG
jgi:hypothetical protein